MTSDRFPFGRMYASFELFGQAEAGRSGRVVNMSAGANWVNACPSVIKCLHRELDSGLTYRNYGRSAGLLAVTNALEHVEWELNSRQYRPTITLTNGTAEGAHLVFQLLALRRRAWSGDVALMVGHGFPLYAHLCDTFGLQFREVLNESGDEPGYLPSIDRVVERIEGDRPALVFLIVPNNPIGECYPEASLRRLARTCEAAGATLLVDRVCLLPWDDGTGLANAVAPLLESGLGFVVDSFSKAESLAGLRTGFVACNEANHLLLIRLTRSRWLNPVIFSTLTLAFCRLAALPTGSGKAGHGAADDGAATCAAAAADGMMGESPGAYAGPDLRALFAEFRTAYRRDLVERQRVIRDNHRALLDRLGAVANRPLNLDAGFNVAVTLPTMAPANEEADQYHLAHDYGVGLLTEACFRVSQRAAGNYFVRLGLTLPAEEFRRGLDALCRYFGA